MRKFRKVLIDASNMKTTRSMVYNFVENQKLCQTVFPENFSHGFSPIFISAIS